MDRESTAWRKEGNRTITSFNTEIHGAGCGLDRVWIGLDPGLDRPRPRIGPTFCVCCTLGAVWQEKDDKVSSLTAWKLGSVALQQFVACLAGWITADINSPIYSIIPKVWINSLGKVWIGGLDQRSESFVLTGAWSRPYILSRSHMYIYPSIFRRW